MGEKRRFGRREAVAAGVLAFALSASVGAGAIAWGNEDEAPQEKVGLRRGAMASWVAAAVGDVAEQGARSRSAEAQRMMQGYLQAKEKATKSSDAHRSGAGEGTEKASPARKDENERLEGSMDEGPSSASSEKRDESSAARASGPDGEKEESAPSETEGGEGEQAGAKPSEPSSNAPRESESHEEATGSAKGETAENALSAGTLLIRGATIPYVDVRGGTTPSSGGGLWLGSDAVDDGSWGYFVGHNPGSFAPVRSLSLGDVVTVCDRRGAQRAYVVREVFQVEETATWKTIASRVTGYGESVVLQTCAGSGRNIIAVAA